MSDRPRNVLLCCYNKATNDPVKVHHHPGYTPLDRVPDERIKEIGLATDAAGRAFYDPHSDATIENPRSSHDAT